MLDKIIKKFANTIEIHIEVDNFTFICNSNIIQLGTFIYVYSDGKNEQVASIGESPQSIEKLMKINLFKSHKPNVLIMDKYNYLCAFFREGVVKVTGKRTMIRPKFIFKGIENLEEALCGYEKNILEKASKDAGATECNFV